MYVITYCLGIKSVTVSQASVSSSGYCVGSKEWFFGVHADKVIYWVCVNSTI